MPSSLKHVMSGELHSEVTREPIGRLHKDGLGAIRCQSLQHLSKAGALVDAVGTAHGLIVILIYNGEPCPLAKASIAAR